MGDVVEDVIFGMFKSILSSSKETEKARLVSHWFQPYEDFKTSPIKFYGSVIGAIEKREIPEIGFSRVNWKERGGFSASRVYLRISWRRYIWDLCAAPFGTGFFFSSWLVMLPPSLTLLNWLGIATTLLVLPYPLYETLGLWRSVAIAGFGIMFVWWLLNSGRLQADDRVEQFLLGMTVLGAIWERFRRPLTYFELDSALMFQSAVHSSVLEVIDEITKSEGLSPLSELERKPVMADFFKR